MKHFCIFILLLAQLVFTSFGQVRVLCVGDDGHISVEQVHDVCSQTSAVTTDHTSDLSCCPATHPACDDPSNFTVIPAPCNDVPLPANHTQITSRDQTQAIDSMPAQAPLPWHARLLPVVLKASTFTHWAFDPHTSPHRRQTSLALATVILTI